MLSTVFSLRGPHGPDASQRRLRDHSCMRSILGEIQSQISCLRQEVATLRGSSCCAPALVPVGICSTEQAADVNNFIRSVFIDGTAPTPKVSVPVDQPMSYDIGTSITVEDNGCKKDIREDEYEHPGMCGTHVLSGDYATKKEIPPSPSLRMTEVACDETDSLMLKMRCLEDKEEVMYNLVSSLMAKYRVLV